MIYTPFREFEFSSTTRFPTDQGSILEFNESDVFAQISLGLHHRDESDDLPNDILLTRFRVADCHGVIWEYQSHFRSDYIVGLIQGLLEPMVLIPFGDVGQRIKDAFDGPDVLRDVRFSSDDRFYRTLIVGSEVIEIPFHYTTISFDITIIEDEIHRSRLCVRINENSLFKNGDDVGALIFVTAPFIGPNTAAFNLENDWWQANPIPTPVVFRKTEDLNTPNPKVKEC
jgi:hypothetical protein